MTRRDIRKIEQVPAIVFLPVTRHDPQQQIVDARKSDAVACAGRHLVATKTGSVRRRRHLIVHGLALLDYAIARRSMLRVACSLTAITKCANRKMGTSMPGTTMPGTVVNSRVPGSSVRIRNGVPGIDRVPSETATTRSRAPRAFQAANQFRPT